MSSNKFRKLFAAGYQLTPDAYNAIASKKDLEEIIEKIISSKPEKDILSLKDIQVILGLIELDVKEDEPIVSKAAELPVKKEDAVSQNLPVKSTSSVDVSPTITKPREEKFSSSLEIITNPHPLNTAVSVTSFAKYFKSRFEQISRIFKKRRDIVNIVTTTSLQDGSRKDQVALIAMVNSVRKSKAGNITLELEDLEGSIEAKIWSSNSTLVSTSDFVLVDSVLCFVGTWNEKRQSFYINNIHWPDVPFNRQRNRSPESIFALFISDIHIGSKKFAGNLFLRLIKFLNGELDSDKYNAIGKKIKYLFIGGDLVDGVGVYPDQSVDLQLDSIRLQYLLATEYLEKIRQDIEIVIIPGNHDGTRNVEPQTPISKDFAQELYDLPNVHLLGSPAYLKAHNVEILMSHGNSIMDINAAIPAISHETSIPAMREMLKNRHLVPIYGKRTSIAPEPVDRLVISRVPDIFQTGHTHIAGAEVYRNIVLINSGTFQYQTSYQQSMNINPTTGVTFLVNLKNPQPVKIDFREIT
ncbi:MAG: metallophosphoesterase [Candidatus Heimdallarchaeaceae archaeon]